MAREAPFCDQGFYRFVELLGGARGVGSRSSNQTESNNRERDEAKVSSMQMYSADFTDAENSRIDANISGPLPYTGVFFVFAMLSRHVEYRRIRLRSMNVRSKTPAPPPSAGDVHGQLARLLGSPPFRSSRRCSDFLRYVVEESSAGRTDQLKERTVGVAVFDRDPDYDTNQDPVVRNTAGQVRKRLAQYYCEPGRERRFGSTCRRVLTSPKSMFPKLRLLCRRLHRQSSRTVKGGGSLVLPPRLR